MRTRTKHKEELKEIIARTQRKTEILTDGVCINETQTWKLSSAPSVSSPVTLSRCMQVLDVVRA